jgi:hypothetical protein
MNVITPEQQGQVARESVFLAGGITDCPDWQADVIAALKDEDDDLTIANPRRDHFDVRDPSMSVEQIEWEFRWLHRCDVISFWFPKETLCPITLYELGMWQNSGKLILIGVHPDYKRRVDVEIQTRLVMPSRTIVYDLMELASMLRPYTKTALLSG